MPPPARPRRLPLAVACGVLLALSIACERPAPFFSVENARAHVNRLAGAVGPRPAGTAANRRAREYLVDQLRFFGFTVRAQDAEARVPRFGLSAHVVNIIAVHPGANPGAIALIAHYDSDDAAPGAGDDGLGVATCLEVGRLLAARRDRRHGLMVLLTDAEEKGLLGAEALVTDPEVRARVLAYINVESTGDDGPSVLFETGPGQEWVLRAWAEAAPRPRGGSAAYELYKRLPNDTDFSVLKRTGIPGLNVAAIGDSYAYHTPLDAPERLTNEALAQTGENVLATALALDRRAPGERTTRQAIYFAIAGLRTIVWSPLGARIVAIAAILIGLWAWLRCLRAARIFSGWVGLLLAWLWTVVGVAFAFAGMLGAAWLLRAVREVYHPWYAHPGRFWTMLVLSAIVVVHLLWVIGARLPRVVRAPRHPVAVWIVALPIWIVLAAAAEWVAPAAAYFFTLPLLLTAAATLAAPERSGAAARLAALVPLVVTVTLWVPDAIAMLRFSVPLLGRLPAITPIWLYPASFTALAMVLIPAPLAILIAGPPRVPTPELPRWRRRTRLLLTPALTLALVLSFAWTYFAEAYTSGRPLRQAVQYVADQGSGRAAWEIGGNEPGLDVHPGRGGPVAWQPARGPLLTGVPVAPVRAPFAFRADAPIVAAPLTVFGRSTLADNELQLEVTLTPAVLGASVIVMLPPGVVPVRASRPGVVRDGWWTSAYAAATGAVTFSLALPRTAEGRIRDARAALVSRSLPGSTGPSGLPAWLAQQRTVWDARSLYLTRIAWTPGVAEVPPLR